MPWKSTSTWGTLIRKRGNHQYSTIYLSFLNRVVLTRNRYKLANSIFFHFYEDGTILLIPSEILPPLTTSFLFMWLQADLISYIGKRALIISFTFFEWFWKCQWPQFMHAFKWFNELPRRTYKYTKHSMSMGGSNTTKFLTDIRQQF